MSLLDHKSTRAPEPLPCAGPGCVVRSGGLMPRARVEGVGLA